MTTSRRWLGRLGAVLGGILTPIILFEVVLRVVGAVMPGEYQTVDLNTASEAFGRVNMANRAGWKKSSEFSTHVRLNDRGLRGPNIPYEKTDGTYRILVIGDSFTFGAQVEEEETFVARLGEYLRDETGYKGSRPPEIETINGGVDGWNTYNELAWLQVEGVRYQPDQVVLMFYEGNDPGENYDWMKALGRRDNDPTNDAESWGHDARKALAGSSALYALFESGVMAKLAAPEPADLDVAPLQTRRSSDPDRKERGWDISVDLLRQMHKFCDERNIKLTVVGIPTQEYVVGDERPSRRTETIGDEAGTPMIYLLAPFRATPEDVRSGLYFPKDRHWTPTGHNLAAQTVAPLLTEAMTAASPGVVR